MTITDLLISSTEDCIKNARELKEQAVKQLQKQRLSLENFDYGEYIDNAGKDELRNTIARLHANVSSEISRLS